LVELLIAVLVAGILGTALTRLLVNDSRFAGRQEAMLSARRTARTAMNWTAVELRMLGDSALIAAAPESVTVRVPYVFGTMCDRVGSDHIATLVPSDSLAYATATPDGLAWQRNDGVFQFIAPVGVMTTTDSSTCVADSIHTVPGGQLVAISNVPSGAPFKPLSASLGYLFQNVTYKFAPSVDLPGRVGLWRKASTAAYEELVAPFDTSSGFGFLTDPTLTALPTPPADLTTVLGLELRFVGASESTPRGAAEPTKFSLVSQIRFLNRAN
jgi:hypothetical protein